MRGREEEGKGEVCWGSLGGEGEDGLRCVMCSMGGTFMKGLGMKK